MPADNAVMWGGGWKWVKVLILGEVLQLKIAFLSLAVFKEETSAQAQALNVGSRKDKAAPHHL